MNIAQDEIAPLLVALGEATPAIREIVQHADELRWSILLDDGLVVTAEGLPDVGRLCLCVELGRPHEQDRVKVWEAMLLYSSLRASTGGASMGLAEPEGECQLLCDVAVDAADPAALREAFARFAHDARRWRAAVARGFHLPGEVAPAARDAQLAAACRA